MPPKRKPHAKRRNKKYRAAARRRSYAKHAGERRARQNEKNWRARDAEHRLTAGKKFHEGLTIVTSLAVPLLYIDTQGNVHREENLSAEELIRKWQETHK